MMDSKIYIAYDKFRNALFEEALAHGFSDCEVYYSNSDSFSVKIFGGEISEYKNAKNSGLSFRGTAGDNTQKPGAGHIGYAYSEKLDHSVISKLVKNAADNASVIEEKEVLYPGDSSYPKVNSYNPALGEVSTEKKIDMALEMEKCAYSADLRVKSVDYCQLGTSEEAVSIANSCGMDLSNQSNLAYAYVSARVEENGITKTGAEIWHGNDWADFCPNKVAQAAVDRALSYLNAKSIKSGTYPIIFDNRTACSLMAAFSSVFFAENAQKGFSMLKGKEGEKIASSIITLRDDGVCEHDTFGSMPFDCEGVSAKKKAVISGGVLKTLLYNTKSAAKDGLASTGNGTKASFRSSISTACTNFYITPSDIAPDKMMSDIQEGVLITEMAGLHAGINPVSGDFSISSDGFLIENGQIARPVEQITVAGNFYTMLKDIQSVGSDLRFSVPSAAGTFGMPSIRVKSLAISGL